MHPAPLLLLHPKKIILTRDHGRRLVQDGGQGRARAGQGSGDREEGVGRHWCVSARAAERKFAAVTNRRSRERAEGAFLPLFALASLLSPVRSRSCSPIPCPRHQPRVPWLLTSSSSPGGQPAAGCQGSAGRKAVVVWRRRRPPALAQPAALPPFSPPARAGWLGGCHHHQHQPCSPRLPWATSGEGSGCAT